MSYKPADFLIGVSEVISILLPGAIATYAMTPAWREVALHYGTSLPTGASGWLAFILMAYLIGHLIFLAGSFLDGPYDRLRQALWPREHDDTYQAATALVRETLAGNAGVINTYKYATAILALRSEAALSEVRQLEADSKFFRSVTVLVAVLWTVAVGRTGEAPIETWLLLPLAFACGWRYVERRWKGTKRAFEFVVVLHSSRMMTGAAHTIPNESLAQR